MESLPGERRFLVTLVEASKTASAGREKRANSDEITVAFGIMAPDGSHHGRSLLARRACSMRAWTYLAAVVLGMALSAASLAAPETTTPGTAAQLKVRITDASIAIANNSSMPRGVITAFNVVNAGKKTHNFSLLGHTTRALKPGAHGQFTIDLAHRGAYRYESTYGTDRGNKKLSGFFTVY
jgi:hypothetical protein